MPSNAYKASAILYKLGMLPVPWDHSVVSVPLPSGSPAASVLLLMYQVHSVQPQNAINFSQIYNNSKYTNITSQNKKTWKSVPTHPYSKTHLMSKMRHTQFVNRLHLLPFFHGFFFFLISLILNTHPCPTGMCPFCCLSCGHLLSNFSVLKPLMHLICSTLIHAPPTTQPYFWGPLFSTCSASTHSPVLFFPTCCKVVSPWGLFFYSNLTWIFQTLWLLIPSAHDFRKSLLDLRYTQILIVKVCVLLDSRRKLEGKVMFWTHRQEDINLSSWEGLQEHQREIHCMWIHIRQTG